MMLLAVILSVAPFLQSDVFQSRVRKEGPRILVDDQVLYEGPWKTAEVHVADVAGKRAKQTFGEYQPWKQIVVLIDGEERLRLPVKSLAKPIAWPPLRLDELSSSLKKLTQTVGSKKTLSALVSTEKADFEIFFGPERETRVERTADSFTVFLDGEVLYRITRPARPPPRVEDVVVALNLKRVKAGVGFVRPSAAASRACDLHALYLTKNETQGLSGHDEDPRGIGYTVDGARAGKRSVISPFAPHDPPAEAIESLMATLYHRIALLNPCVGEIGVGWAHRSDGLGFLVVDVGGNEARCDPGAYPIVYPVDGQDEVPLEFGLGAREIPNPIPTEGVSAGYPITIQIPERTGRASDIVAELRAGTLAVSCWLSTPDAPARKDCPQPGVICLIPKEKLKPATRYTVRFEDRMAKMEKEWSFSTRK